MNIEKYSGIIPAFYACYNENGKVSEEGVQALTKHLIDQGVKGLYVGGSSGECIYQSVEERKITLENVMKVAKDKITIIAHVGCNNTADSMELAAHAEALGVDAIASIPPIYFHLPEHGIAKYWNDISAAAPHTDFIIYNIPQLAGVSLTMPLYREMLKNPRVIGVKNSSMPVLDIQMFKMEKQEECVVFNGPDEQLASGLVAGADGGIGGTYAIMPKLYIKIQELVNGGQIQKAKQIQEDVNRIIFKMCSGHGNLYAIMKEILKQRENIDCGGVRAPLANITTEDHKIIKESIEMIDLAMKNYIG